MKNKKTVIITLSVIFCCGIVFSGLIMSVNGFYQNRKLFEAIENNDYAAAKKAVEKGAFLDIRKYFVYLPGILDANPTPLIVACDNGNEDIIKLLVESGADVNKIDNYIDNTPLLSVLNEYHTNRFSIAMYLIQSGADIYVHRGNKTPFSEAMYIFETDNEQTKNENKILIQYLIKHNADQTLSYGENALTCAVHRGNLFTVQYLIENQYYDINMQDEKGNTALMTAVKYEQHDILNLLLDLGADPYIVNAEGKTALDYVNEQNGKIATFEFSD